MTTKDAIKNTIDNGHMLLTTYVSDLSDADLMLRPVPGVNHIAWQLGHLIAAEHQMITQIGFDMPELPEGFEESYAKETSTSDDAGKFLKKDRYLTLLEQQRSATLAALESVSETDLDKPAPEDMRAYAATYGEVFNIIGIHELMHGPQFIAVRRKSGKPVLI